MINIKAIENYIMNSLDDEHITPIKDGYELKGRYDFKFTLIKEMTFNFKPYFIVRVQYIPTGETVKVKGSFDVIEVLYKAVEDRYKIYHAMNRNNKINNFNDLYK